MKGMDNNASHGFMIGQDGYAQMLMGGAGQQGYGGNPTWMGGSSEGVPTSVAGAQGGVPIGVPTTFPAFVGGAQGGVPVGAPTTFPAFVGGAQGGVPVGAPTTFPTFVGGAQSGFPASVGPQPGFGGVAPILVGGVGPQMIHGHHVHHG
ncbi:hypothetical protein COF59_26360, partial [Bacillus pseudomycoides]